MEYFLELYSQQNPTARPVFEDVQHAVRWTAKLNRVDLLKLILQQGGVVTEHVWWKACRYGAMDVLRFIENQVDPHVIHDLGMSMREAASYGNAAVVLYLLNKGVDADPLFLKPFRSALEYGYYDVVKVFIYNTTNPSRYFEILAKQNRYDLIKQLFSTHVFELDIEFRKVNRSIELLDSYNSWIHKYQQLQI